jgi:EAL domain-containing protein (putative c-di-GMP-specific phosphodiesterase class I)
LRTHLGNGGPGRAASPANHNLSISVNLSAKQFLQPNLVADISTLLGEIKLPLEALKLEITESTVMKDPSAAVEMLANQIAGGASGYR